VRMAMLLVNHRARNNTNQFGDSPLIYDQRLGHRVLIQIHSTSVVGYNWIEMQKPRVSRRALKEFIYFGMRMVE